MLSWRIGLYIWRLEDWVISKGLDYYYYVTIFFGGYSMLYVVARIMNPRLLEKAYSVGSLLEGVVNNAISAHVLDFFLLSSSGFLTNFLPMAVEIGFILIGSSVSILFFFLAVLQSEE